MTNIPIRALESGDIPTKAFGAFFDFFSGGVNLYWIACKQEAAGAPLYIYKLTYGSEGEPVSERTLLASSSQGSFSIQEANYILTRTSKNLYGASLHAYSYVTSAGVGKFVLIDWQLTTTIIDMPVISGNPAVTIDELAVVANESTVLLFVILSSSNRSYVYYIDALSPENWSELVLPVDTTENRVRFVPSFNRLAFVTEKTFETEPTYFVTVQTTLTLMDPATTEVSKHWVIWDEANQSYYPEWGSVSSVEVGHVQGPVGFSISIGDTGEQKVEFKSVLGSFEKLPYLYFPLPINVETP